MAAKRRSIRPFLSGFQGLPWEPEELLDMHLDDARAIVGLDDEARSRGERTQEDAATVAYARMLVAKAAAPVDWSR